MQCEENCVNGEGEGEKNAEPLAQAGVLRADVEEGDKIYVENYLNVFHIQRPVESQADWDEEQHNRQGVDHDHVL